MRSSTLAIVVACVAISTVLTACILRADDQQMKSIANWVNFGGAALTFVGLAWAYLRSSTQLRSWFNQRWHRLRFGRRTLVAHAKPIGFGVGFGYGIGYAVRTFTAADREEDQIQRLIQRTDKLLDCLNDLSEKHADALKRIHDLGDGLDRAKAEARKGDDIVRREAGQALAQFAKGMKRAEALDLRWAIAGTFFSMFGALLALWL